MPSQLTNHSHMRSVHVLLHNQNQASRHGANIRLGGWRAGPKHQGLEPRLVYPFNEGGGEATSPVLRPHRRARTRRRGGGGRGGGGGGGGRR